MAKKIVTLYIDDTSLRLMVIQGRQIKKWVELPLEPGLVKNAVVIEETKVVVKIRQLFKVEKVRKRKVIVGVSGLHCLSRPITLPQLPRVMLAEAVRREAKRVLPVPPEQLYLSWLTMPGPEGQAQAFLVAIPRKTADTLLKVLRHAGLKPSFMDLKPLLLARTVKEPAAIIADAQPAEFDIVISVNGIPQPVRTISFPGKALSREEKLSKIREELDRTIQFYNSNNPEKPLASTVPIYVSGELIKEPGLCESYLSELGHPVMALPSPLECPDGMDLSHHMVNIGLALHRLSPWKEAGPSVASLNILPAPYRPKQLSLTKILALPGTVAAIGLIVFLVILIRNASADTAELGRRLESTNQELAQRQELVEAIAGLEWEVTQAEAARDNFTAALGSLEKRGDGIDSNLSETLGSLPGSIRLKSISYANDVLIIQGKAPSEREILSYLAELNAGGGFAEIIITSMSRIDAQWMDFTLNGNLEKQRTGESSVETALNGLPATVNLVSVSYASDKLTVNGRSSNEAELLSYLQDLEACGKFSEVTITSMSRVEDELMDFVLELMSSEGE